MDSLHIACDEDISLHIYRHAEYNFGLWQSALSSTDSLSVLAIVCVSLVFSENLSGKDSDNLLWAMSMTYMSSRAEKHASACCWTYSHLCYVKLRVNNHFHSRKLYTVSSVRNVYCSLEGLCEYVGHRLQLQKCSREICAATIDTKALGQRYSLWFFSELE